MAQVDTSDDADSEGRALAVRLREGHPQALEDAYREYAGLVHSLALRALRDDHDAQDVTQQVFVAAWRSRHTLRPDRGSVGAWLVGITRHAIADAQGQRARHARNLYAVSDQLAATPGVSDADVSLRLLVRAEMNRLGEPRCSIVRMAFFEDRTHEQISVALNLPLGTVKSHVRRGLLQMRESMREVESDAS